MKYILIALLAVVGLFASTATSSSNKSLELNEHNTMLYNAEVTGETVGIASEILQRLVDERGEQDYPIYLVLDCPGGSIYAGEQFIQYAKTIPNLHTVTVFAASMCAGFVEALPGKRYIVENGVLMFHRAQGGFEGYFEDGEVESQLALWKAIVRTMEIRNASRMSMSLADYKAKVVYEWWMYGAGAVESKGADELIDIKCTRELIELGACPLFRFSQGE